MRSAAVLAVGASSLSEVPNSGVFAKYTGKSSAAAAQLVTLQTTTFTVEVGAVFVPVINILMCVFLRDRRVNSC
jgi:hypothetical protein